MHWSELFNASEDFRYPLNLRPGNGARFYQATEGGDALLAERRRWLTEATERHAAARPECEMALAEAAGFLQSKPPSRLAGIELVLHFGQRLEPDFLLLVGPQLKVVAGCICFPSMWAPEEKFGHPLAEVHGPVPGLNAQLGAQLERFFSRLKPGSSWERSNWGLSRSAELNQHPLRKLPRLSDNESVDDIWLRVEHQSLVRLPRTDAVLFGIRIENVPLSVVVSRPEAKRGLRHQLATMPDATVAYKGLAAAHSNLLRLLAE